MVVTNMKELCEYAANKRKEFYRLSAEEIKMVEYLYYSKYNNSIHNTNN